MGLQKNVVDLVIAGGQDDRTDPRLAVQPRELVNTRYALGGSLSKRHGSRTVTETAGLQNHRYTSNTAQRKIYGTETLPPCTLVSSKEELLRASRGALDRVLPPDVLPNPNPESRGPLSPIDTLPHYHAERSACPGTTSAPAHVAAYGDVLAVLVTDDTGRGQVATYERDTLRPIATYPAPASLVEARIVLAPYQTGGGDPVRITPLVYYVTATAELRVVPLVLDAFSLPSYLVASNVGTFDVTPAIVDSGTGLGNDTSWITWSSSTAPLNRASLALVRVASGALVLGTPVAFGGTNAAPQYLALDAKELGDVVHVAYGYTIALAASLNAYAFNSTPTPTAAWGPTAIETATPGTLRGSLVVQSRGTFGERCSWAYTLHDANNGFGAEYTTTRSASTDAAGTLTTLYDSLHGAYLVSKPWLGDGEAVFAVVYLKSPAVEADVPEGSTYAIVRFRNPDDKHGPVTEYDAYLSPALAYNLVGETYTAGAQVVLRTVADRTAEGGTATAATFVLPCGPDVDPREPTHPVALYTATPVSSYGAADAVEDFVFSAGAVMAYDGDRCFEATFPVRLRTLHYDAEGTITGGGLVQGARYGWRQCIAYRDARSVLHRSAPSDAVFHTMLTTGNVISITGEELYTFTRRFRSAEEPITTIEVVIELYRTEANGATFYLENQEGGGGAVGTLSDEDLRTQPVLYTTSGALEHGCPPPSRYAVLALGRVFLLGTEDGLVWPSGVLLSGEAPWWNAVTSFPVPGLGAITGGAELDLALLVFRENAIYAVTGDGPADNGDGGFQIQPVATDIGCIDARSIVRVPDGVLFQSNDGIAIVTRALSVERVGKPVEGFLSGITSYAYAGISSAVNLPAETEARFSVQRYDGAPKRSEAAVCYRLAGMQAPAWAEFQWATHGVPGGMRVVAACLHENFYTWITDNGYVLREAPGTWLDGFTSEALSVYVPSTAWLAAWKPGPTQAWARIWRVGLLGDRKDAHDLTVEIFHDYGEAPVQTRAWTGAEVAALPVEQLKVHVVRQKAESVGVRIKDTAPTDAFTTTGEGLVIAGVSLEVGGKPGMHRRPAVQKR